MKNLRYWDLRAGTAKNEGIAICGLKKSLLAMTSETHK
jgi:hypothetical protein